MDKPAMTINPMEYIAQVARKKDHDDFEDSIRKLDNKYVESKLDEPTSIGVKYDVGKPRVGLVLAGFNQALLEVARVGTKGADKYSDFGFLEVDNGQARYTDAMLRHWLAEMSGEVLDPELQELHAACVAWNALARLELLLRDK